MTSSLLVLSSSDARDSVLLLLRVKPRPLALCLEKLMQARNKSGGYSGREQDPAAEPASQLIQPHLDFDLPLESTFQLYISRCRSTGCH